MASHVTAKRALFDLLDGTPGSRTLLGLNVYEDGQGTHQPLTGATYGAIWVEWGSGEPVAVGYPRYTRQTGAVIFEARAGINTGDAALRLYDEWVSRYEGIDVDVESGIDEILLRQATQLQTPGVRGSVYVINGRVPFLRNRLAAAP